MFTPRFTITNKIINLIASVERQYGQLLGEPLIPSLALSLAQENKILATHFSTSIEGNPLNQREVTNILLEDKIPISKSEVEVTNYFRALNHITVVTQHKKPISMNLVLELHRYVMDSIDNKKPGKLRESAVFIGHKGREGYVVKHNPPAHTKAEIIRALTALFSWLTSEKELHVLIKAAVLHHQAAFIHPFFDGNGRVARLLTAYYLLCNNYEVTKYFILDDYYDIDRTTYSDKLHSADGGDKTAWIEYFLEGISHSLFAAIGRIKDLSGRRLAEIEGEKRVLVSKREEDVLQIVLEKKVIKMNDVAQAFGVTRQQAHSVLQKLVAKDLLVKHGKTKKSYYELKKKTL